MKKILLVALIIFASVFIAKDKIPTLKERSNGTTSTLERVATVTVSQTVEFPTGEKKEDVSVLVPEGTTGLELLKQTTKVITKGEGENAFITQIGNTAALEEKRQYWSFYVNGKPASVGAGSYKLKENDKVLWKIETY